MKLKVYKEHENKSAKKNRRSRIRNGRVKKLNKKFGSMPKNSELTIHEDVKIKHGFSNVPHRKPFDKMTGSKIKHLKKKFGKELVGINSTSKPKVSEGAEGKFNKKRKSGKGKSKKREKKRGVKDGEKEGETEELSEKLPPLTRSSDDPIPRKNQWINKQRVLIFACRGISTRDRHLMKDLQRLMPHSRPESKMERRENLSVVNELCSMKHCNKCILIEGRANRDVYMWLSNVPDGPSVKFLLQNIYTMQELKFTGNCLVGSRPLLSFDKNFDNQVNYRVIKELLIQVFGTPNRHPKSQPFYDHVFSFSILDKRIWFRNYQILSEDGALVEIGPRFVMNPVKIFQSSFGGKTLWENKFYVTPTRARILLRQSVGGKYLNKLSQKKDMLEKQKLPSFKLPETDEIFSGNTWETAKELVSKKTKVGGALKKRKLKKKQGKNKMHQGSTNSWSVQDTGEDQ